MFASLRLRLTTWYVLAAVALVTVVMVASTILALTTIARTANESIDTAIRQGGEIAKLYHREQRPFDAAAPQIVQYIRRGTLRVLVLNSANVPVAGADEAFFRRSVQRMRPHVPFRPATTESNQERLLWAIASSLGVHPRVADIEGGSLVVLANPVTLAGRLWPFLIAMSTLGTLAVLAAVFSARYITGQALQPLIDVTAALRRLSEGDFTPRMIVTKQRNEIGELARAYNGAVDQVNSAFEERLRNEEHMRRFIADAGHELRTPLTVVMGYLDVLRRGAMHDNDLSGRILDTMSGESRRMRVLIEKLILLARMEQPEQPELAVVDLSVLAARCVDSLRALDPQERLHVRTSNDAFVVADEGELYEAICNLVDNALKYAGTDVDVTVEAREQKVTLEVADRGPGMSKEDQLHAFERFYRGARKNDVEGTGLGLSIAMRAVERANGTLSLQSNLGEGCRFTIALERVMQREPEREAPTSAASSSAYS